MIRHDYRGQVIFVFFMAIGNMIGYSIMKIWDVPAFHMLKLMLILVQTVKQIAAAVLLKRSEEVCAFVVLLRTRTSQLG
jgi:hypothetical protein